MSGNSRSKKKKTESAKNDSKELKRTPKLTGIIIRLVELAPVLPTDDPLISRPYLNLNNFRPLYNNNYPNLYSLDNKNLSVLEAFQTQASSWMKRNKRKDCSNKSFFSRSKHQNKEKRRQSSAGSSRKILKRPVLKRRGTNSKPATSKRRLCEMQNVTPSCRRIRDWPKSREDRKSRLISDCSQRSSTKTACQSSAVP